jgi:hypothetical protein
MGKMVRAGAGIFDKLEPEPHKNGPAPQHCSLQYRCCKSMKLFTWDLLSRKARATGGQTSDQSLFSRWWAGSPVIRGIGEKTHKQAEKTQFCNFRYRYSNADIANETSASEIISIPVVF